MLQPVYLLLLADVILVLHALFVAFLVFGLVAIYLGGILHWAWVRNRMFRILHLGGIGIVVIQSWFGFICFLTNWETALRDKAGTAAYEGSFIQYWLQTILYYTAPHWFFALAYSLFGGLVIISWFVVPPAR